jgi:hypothetical protein
LASRITLDRYVYEDIYPAFKAATDEKELTANLNRRFLNYLAERNMVLTGGSPISVADIGCGPCDTIVKYLTGVKFAPGFIVRATDYISEYADSRRGEALKTLAAAQAHNTIKLAAFSARAGDAFGGRLIDLLSDPESGATTRRAFGVVFASHVMYHAESASDVVRIVVDVVDNVLAPGGVCILYHLAKTRGTFQEFRARFGSQAGAAADSDTGAVTIDDPPEQIRSACGELGLPLYQAEFIATVRFGNVGDSEWQAFKDPRTYDQLADSNPEAYEDLKRLYFVVQRAPLEFEADRSPTGLNAFIDEIRPVIEANRYVLPAAERIQVFLAADSSPALRTAIPEALAASMASVSR